MIQLQTSKIKVAFKTKGAELCSLVDLETGVEHIWQANPSIWGRHAPVLFPIVGQVEGNKYTIDGEEYELNQHGFARDQEFEIKEISDTEVTFGLIYNEKSLKVYPYKFELLIKYSVEEEKLTIGYEVRNLDTKEIYFSIGAHPGFSCPFYKGESLEDYEIIFNKSLTEDRLLFANGLLTGEIQKDFLKGEQIISLNEETFDNDAIIFETEEIEIVGIRKKGEGKTLIVNTKGWPLLGIWSKPKANAPYICIEPWCGIASTINSMSDFKKKKAIEKLDINGLFKKEFSVSIK